VLFFEGSGAGHFVKMVHNGIEYALMQAIAEAYELLAHKFKNSEQEIADHFSAWNQSEIDSYLMTLQPWPISRLTIKMTILTGEFFITINRNFLVWSERRAARRDADLELDD
jgi:hypothetical protein